MIARRDLLPSSLESRSWKRWRRTQWRNSRALSNRRECSCGRCLRCLAAIPSRDRSFGGNPPWDQLSYASREAVFPYLSLSLSLFRSLSFSTPFSLRINLSLSSCIPLRLSLSLSFTISVAYSTNSAHRLSTYTAKHERNNPVQLDRIVYVTSFWHRLDCSLLEPVT